LLSALGLHGILSHYGFPRVTGSYALRLMTWRDLDIPRERSDVGLVVLWLGGRLVECLSPVRMHYRNERLARTQGLPNGLYCGIYLGDERAGAWKIGIRAVDSRECDRLTAFIDSIAGRLTPKLRHRI
jgi:hypothetical protein